MNPIDFTKERKNIIIVLIIVVLLAILIWFVLAIVRENKILTSKSQDSVVKKTSRPESANSFDSKNQSDSTNLGAKKDFDVSEKDHPAKEKEVKKTAKTSTLDFDKKNLTLKQDEVFELQAMINPVDKKIGAIALHVSYDAQKIKLEAVEAAGVFTDILMPAKIDNETGNVAIDLGVPPNLPFVDSRSAVAVFKFKTLSQEGVADIIFTDKTEAAAENEAGNVIASTENAKVTITR